MTSHANFAIRRITGSEVALAIDRAAAEGWNPGLHDAECFIAADPQGFFVGELDGVPVACMSAVAYDAAFGFIGLYIVDPPHRGKGYGRQVWDAGMAYLGKRNIGLDGVVAQQQNYRRSGFTLAYRNVRYVGRAQGGPPAGVVAVATLPFEELAAYDRAMFPAQRPQFLECWVRQPDATALAVVQADRIAGYGVVRACRSGYKIGPLFADDAEIADRLFQALAATVAGQTIHLDVPEANAGAVALAQRHGMSIVFETARMYTQAPPPIALERVYGVTTFELG